MEFEAVNKYVVYDILLSENGMFIERFDDELADFGPVDDLDDALHSDLGESMRHFCSITLRDIQMQCNITIASMTSATETSHN